MERKKSPCNQVKLFELEKLNGIRDDGGVKTVWTIRHHRRTRKHFLLLLLFYGYIHFEENNDIANQQFNDMDLFIKLIEMYLPVIYT